jgi:GNAT superfamily N-acetyltransferase
MANIRLVDSTDERLAVYRFRYSIYVEEMGLNESDADHAGKLISDALDGPAAMILAAWDGDRIIGTTRTNLIRDGGIGGYLEYYRLIGLTPAGVAESSITTRLMVHPEFRRTTLSARLACESFRWGLSQGVRANFIDCAADNHPFFAGLGYKVLLDDFSHPEFGPGFLLRLDLYDLEHLVKVRSPFRRILSAWLAEREKLPAELIGACTQ